jgi:hypothetical protein
MSSAVEDHVLGRITEAPIKRLPSPHFYIDGVFPEDYYGDLIANMPGDDDFTCLGDTGRVPKGAYRERFVFLPTKDEIEKLPAGKREFWRDLSKWLYGERFFRSMVGKFAQSATTRFAGKLDKVKLTSEVLVVRDRTNYSIGPHTDAPHRFLSMLFYLPPDSSREHLGTSLYMPLDRSFTCEGGPHYEFDKFVKVDTMPYRPNSLFCFLRTDTSFHGVEPIEDADIVRDLILYDVRIANPSALKSSDQEVEAPALAP